MDSENAFASLPLHHPLFVRVRDGGGLHRASSAANLHNISIGELKPHRVAAV